MLPLLAGAKLMYPVCGLCECGKRARDACPGLVFFKRDTQTRTVTKLMIHLTIPAIHAHVTHGLGCYQRYFARNTLVLDLCVESGPSVSSHTGLQHQYNHYRLEGSERSCLLLGFTNNTMSEDRGANWFRPGTQLSSSRVVVGQLATLIADQNLTAETQFALAA